MPNITNILSSSANVELHFDLNKHLPLTPYSLPIAIWDLIEANWADKGVVFTQSHPRENVGTPTIVWSIYRRVPGRDGLEINKPRLRGTVPDEEDPTITYDQYAQWMTIIYQFDIYDIDNESTNDLTEEFDELMFHITPILRELGVSEWIFDEQLVDKELERAVSQEIYKRTLRFRCILERKFVKSVPIIQSIWTQLGIEANHMVENESVVRSDVLTKDRLAKNWISSVWSITKEYKLEYSSISSSGTQYLEGVDFKITLSIPDGASYIEWLPRGKHPLPGEVYYVTYFYRDIGLKFPATKTSPT
jgi:hypothetical protein